MNSDFSTKVRERWEPEPGSRLDQLLDEVTVAENAYRAAMERRKQQEQELAELRAGRGQSLEEEAIRRAKIPVAEDWIGEARVREENQFGGIREAQARVNQAVTQLQAAHNRLRTAERDVQKTKDILANIQAKNDANWEYNKTHTRHRPVITQTLQQEHAFTRAKDEADAAAERMAESEVYWLLGPQEEDDSKTGNAA